MENVTFSPKIQQKKDPVESVLCSVAQNILVAMFGLLPIMFIPLAYIPVDYAKTIVVIVGSLVALIFFGLSVLRAGSFKVSAPMFLVAFWGLALAALISAILSGDIRDALLGDLFGVHTSVFIVLMAFVSTALVLFNQSKTTIMRLYLVLLGSSIALTLFHVTRLVFGAKLLSLDIFVGMTSSPIGGWNQLALFFGLVILLSLMAMEQLPLTKWGRILFSAIVLLSLTMLAVVNFVSVWVVLALVSLVMLMYSLTKDRFSPQMSMMAESKTPVTSTIVLTAVFVVSLAFVLGGSYLGSLISNYTGISYLEVRPSLGATVDIARSVFKENVFVGMGPNKFVDAWRLYKDSSINQTAFWGTDFADGSGYLTTFIVNTGVFGLLAFLAFAFFWFRAGFKLLFSSQSSDRFWYFVAGSSFVAATYIWVMSSFYSSGATMMLLLAVYTGTFAVAYANIIPTKSFGLSVFNNKRSVIVLIAIIMASVIASSGVMYYTVRHYTSVATFNRAAAALASGTAWEEVETSMANAYGVYPNDFYLTKMAEYQLARMNALSNVAKPTDEQKQQFQTAAANGLNAINLALQADNTDSRYYAIQGGIYGVLAAAGVEGATDRATDSFAKAHEFEPSNPEYYLMEAQMWLGAGNTDKAVELINTAVSLKPNYADALFLLAQLQVSSGEVDKAIATTATIASLEPNNPARFYQLGVLYLSDDKTAEAALALEKAVSLDANYANARYFLAVAYAQLDRTDEALVQLNKVAELNPDNETVNAAIEAVKSGKFGLKSANLSEQPVAGTDEAVDNTDLDSSLVTPVNSVSGDAVQAETTTTE